MLLTAGAACLGAPTATGSAHRATAALAPPRAAVTLRRAYHSARGTQPGGQPARRASTFRAAVQAAQETENAAHASGNTTVTFRLLNKKVDFGQQVLVVGNVPELGGWELGRAPQMTWSEGDNWSVEVELPAGSEMEFKFALQSPNHAPVWEKCDNRHISADPAAVSSLECDWDVAETTIVAPEAPKQAAASAAAPEAASSPAAATIVGIPVVPDATLSNGRAAAAALSAAAEALEAKDRAAALAAVQEAAAAAAAVVAAAEATAAAVAKAVQAAEALVAELDAPSGAQSSGAQGPGASAQAAAAQVAADARYSAEQLDFMRRKLDAIQAMPAVSRQASTSLRNGSPEPAAPSRPASPQPPAAAAKPAAGQFTPEQMAFLQRKSQSPPPRSSSPAPRPRSSSPAPRQRSASPPAPAAAAAPPPPPAAAPAAPAPRPRSSSPAPRPRSSSPASSRPVSAVYAKDMEKYSLEQLEFLRRSGKL